MSVFRIGWVNPREDGDQVRMLQDNCTKLGLDHDRIVKTGKTFKGRCDDCAKEPLFHRSVQHCDRIDRLGV